MSAATWLVVAMSTWTSDWIRRMDDRDTLGVVDGVVRDGRHTIADQISATDEGRYTDHRCGDHPGTVLFVEVHQDQHAGQESQRQIAAER